MGGLFTLVAILLPMCLLTALIETVMTIPERIRDRRAVAFLRRRSRYYNRGY